jgi:hypothetical protein
MDLTRSATDTKPFTPHEYFSATTGSSKTNINNTMRRKEPHLKRKDS